MFCAIMEKAEINHQLTGHPCACVTSLLVRGPAGSCVVKHSSCLGDSRWHFSALIFVLVEEGKHDLVQCWSWFVSLHGSAGASLFIKMCNHVDFIGSHCECNVKSEESSVI
jgi:hypothetical protein